MTITDEEEGYDDYDDPMYEQDDDDVIDCPYCDQEIYADTPKCPNCGQYISKEDTPAELKHWWLLVGFLLAMFAVSGWFMF